LPVAIQEQAVKPAIQIIVVGDIAPRPIDRVELFHAAQRGVQEAVQRHHRMGIEPGLHVQRGDVEEVVHAALEGDQRLVHVGFARRHRGIEHQPPHGCRIGDVDGRTRPIAIAVTRHGIVGPAHREAPLGDQPCQDKVQNALHRPFR
jgi:hypothetical protein